MSYLALLLIMIEVMDLMLSVMIGSLVTVVRTRSSGAFLPLSARMIVLDVVRMISILLR